MAKTQLCPVYGRYCHVYSYSCYHANDQDHLFDPFIFILLHTFSLFYLPARTRFHRECLTSGTSSLPRICTSRCFIFFPPALVRFPAQEAQYTLVFCILPADFAIWAASSGSFNAAQPPRPQQFALERIFGSAVRNGRICFKSSLFSRSGHGRKIFCSSMILFPSPSSCNFS